jgi:hypothetical protein
MTFESHALRIWWNSRQETASSCGGRLARTINRLAKIDDTFRSWDKYRTPVEEQALDRLFEENRSYYDFSPDKVFLEPGFRIQMKNQFKKPNSALIDMRVGAFGVNNPHWNSFSIALSNKRSLTASAWTASELRPVMQIAIEEWAPQEGSIDCFRYRDHLRSYQDARGKRRLFLPWDGWITYIPWPKAALVVAPDGVRVDRLDNGGCLYTLCEEAFTIDNSRHMALAAAMQRALEPIQSP